MTLGTLEVDPTASPLFERTRAGCFVPRTMPPSWRHSSDHTPRRPRSRCWRRGRTAASYDDLLDQLEAIERYLRAGGIAPTGRVAVALPNGPDAAAAVLGTVAAAVCAPLAPDLPESEFANQLTALGAGAVMVLADTTPRHAPRHRRSGFP